MCNTILACPLCDNTTSQKYMELKDHSVSKELFQLVQCTDCSFLYTNPRPYDKDLEAYYQSDTYISHSQRSNGLLDSLYYMARNIMLNKKRKWIFKMIGSKPTLLDFGCGTGSFVNHLLSHDWDAWGVEPNHNARSIANQNHNQVFQSLDTLPDKQFEIITLWHVLEHVSDLDAKLKELISRLNETGLMFIALPNCGSYDAKYYQDYWAGYDVPRHLSHFTPESMKLLVKKHRLHLVKLIPLKLDAFYISMLSEKYRTGSTINAIFQAAKSNFLARQNQSNYSSLVYVLKK